MRAHCLGIMMGNRWPSPLTTVLAFQHFESFQTLLRCFLPLPRRPRHPASETAMEEPTAIKTDAIGTTATRKISNLIWALIRRRISGRACFS